MGNFYKNVTVVGPGQGDVVAVLARHERTAYVTPTRRGVTVVFDRQADAVGNPTELGDVALTLSQELACPTMAAAVYDDDVLLLDLYDRGVQVAEYNSSGFSSMAPAALARVLGLPLARRPLLWALLNAPRIPLFLLIRVLGMPAWAGATGYKYIQQGEPPPDIDPTELVHVGEVRPWRLEVR